MMRKDKVEYLPVTGKIVGEKHIGALFTEQLVKWMNCDNVIEFLRKHQKENTLLPISFDMAL